MGFGSIPRSMTGHFASPWHSLAAADALQAQRSDAEHGLSAEQARQRLLTHGPNSLPAAPRRSAARRLALQFHNPLIYVLLASGAITLALRHWIDAGVILGVVLINAAIGFVQEGRAEKALEAVRSLLASHAIVLRDGQRHDIDAAELVPGDVVFLESGMRVPADLRLLRSHTLRIDESALTGESVAVDKDSATVAADAPLAEQTGMAFAGTVARYGQGWGVVAATGAEKWVWRRVGLHRM